jgi:hypothetical protein
MGGHALVTARESGAAALPALMLLYNNVAEM